MPPMSNGVTPAQFIAKWSRVELSEPAASQSHFNDLCRLLGQPNPTDYDPTGEEYCFAKGVAVTGPASAGSKGERGFADVWWRGKFAWEYRRMEIHDILLPTAHAAGRISLSKRCSGRVETCEPKHYPNLRP